MRLSAFCWRTVRTNAQLHQTVLMCPHRRQRPQPQTTTDNHLRNAERSDPNRVWCTAPAIQPRNSPATLLDTPRGIGEDDIAFHKLPTTTSTAHPLRFLTDSMSCEDLHGRCCAEPLVTRPLITATAHTTNRRRHRSTNSVASCRICASTTALNGWRRSAQYDMTASRFAASIAIATLGS